MVMVRIDDQWHKTTPPTIRTVEPMAAVEMRAIRKVYGERAVLDGLDLTVSAGELVALLGRNGAGKTTTFEILLGLVRPTSGTASVFGSAPGRGQRRRTGAMLQSDGLPTLMTVHELVCLVGRSYPRSIPVEEVLEQTGLRQRADTRISDLSGGERQRVQLALAIVGAPELLLLDEPTASMDVGVRRDFWCRARASVIEGAAILFATHDLRDAAAADRVVVLDGGRAIAAGRPSELARRGHHDLEQTFLELTGHEPADSESAPGRAGTGARR